jgi:two-component system, LytTR family, response regulator
MRDVRLRTLIVDDEPLARRRLRRLLAANSAVSVEGECESASEATAVVCSGSIDLLVADIEMPGVSGLDLLPAHGSTAPDVIFVTAHEHYAARAFDGYAVDYVLKPVRAARLAEAIRRAVVRRSSRSITEGPRFMTRVPVTKGGRLVPVRVEHIDWIEAAENYVTLHCGADTFLYRSPLADLTALLDPDRFLRIHRSVVVQMDRVRALTPSPSGDCVVELTSGTKLRLSRTYRAGLDRLLTGR